MSIPSKNDDYFFILSDILYTKLKYSRDSIYFTYSIEKDKINEGYKTLFLESKCFLKSSSEPSEIIDKITDLINGFNTCFMEIEIMKNLKAKSNLSGNNNIERKKIKNVFFDSKKSELFIDYVLDITLV